MIEAMNSFVLRPGSEYADEGKSLLALQRNPKAGRTMPRTHLTAAELQELHDLAAQWGKIIARRTGDDAIDFDLHALEQIAQAAAAGLVEGTLQCLLQRQADALADQQPCPSCGRFCPLTYEDRTVQVRGGVALPYHEPVCHCPDCRRDFFPPPPAPAP
jgi:hypothetical protein